MVNLINGEKKVVGNKLTVDLDDDNKALLENLKKTKKQSYGSTINEALRLLYSVPENVKDELSRSLYSKAELINTEMYSAGVIEREALKLEKNAYERLAAFYHNNLSKRAEEIDESMKKVDVKNGYVICPKEWIVVNADKNDEYEYAGCVEIRNGGVNIPHFLFLAPVKNAYDYSNAFISEIDELCKRAYPEYGRILEQQVEPKMDPNNMGKVLNLDEWRKAPKVGYFSIYVQGDPLFEDDYEPPAGAKVIRI